VHIYKKDKKIKTQMNQEKSKANSHKRTWHLKKYEKQTNI